ncbi:HEPN domain-containing protein [Leptospira levettii]|uniref:HEPN domain-containing protein n=1 Tax=Leptospira levettii TaxID=2023178 RepID=UPI00223D9936|nr:HEPN domain-containing protein [Leptospira levettii]MCW7498527.1 HEPN domain-containing protein [Leptospira levettii]
MKKKDNQLYTTSHVERSHQWLVKAADTLEEAKVLSKSGRTRLGAYNRLYYSAHHTAVALLKLIGNSSKTHTSIINQFSKEWIKNRLFPKKYGSVISELYDERDKADYGEFVPSMESDLNKKIKVVSEFYNKTKKIIPEISIVDILHLITEKNPDIRDFSFDIYCPKSYYHHTRFTLWLPKGRLTNKALENLYKGTTEALKLLKVKENQEYTIGINSRTNQYNSKQLILLDFDDISSFPAHKILGEPGYVFRTQEGYHFIGTNLYSLKDWTKRMRSLIKVASKDHIELSLKRGYATVRITTSIRKPFKPVYSGKTEDKPPRKKKIKKKSPSA